MAMSCAHCRSADVAPLFDSFQCFNCGRHTTTDGRQVLPDSLTFEPNHNESMVEWGWPYADAAPSVKRGQEVCAVQWGSPIEAPKGTKSGE